MIICLGLQEVVGATPLRRLAGIQRGHSQRYLAHAMTDLPTSSEDLMHALVPIGHSAYPVRVESNQDYKTRAHRSNPRFSWNAPRHASRRANLQMQGFTVAKRGNHSRLPATGSQAPDSTVSNQNFDLYSAQLRWEASVDIQTNKVTLNHLGPSLPQMLALSVNTPGLLAWEGCLRLGNPRNIELMTAPKLLSPDIIKLACHAIKRVHYILSVLHKINGPRKTTSVRTRIKAAPPTKYRVPQRLPNVKLNAVRHRVPTEQQRTTSTDQSHRDTPSNLNRSHETARPEK